ncbi:2-methoxy-6-polyprenyl-1,4-benzoquinol methylase, mitochondrial isoform X1 [Paramormyrops kingsleyae]|uniref:2-methoxy-6-polyprenyl-1,4-benzoquinol methylase, mitochondrial isoform X1 n=1 Tax=Paramormyrops kingsleyae TaxID=1676925 RepID=UPI003B97396F
MAAPCKPCIRAALLGAFAFTRGVLNSRVAVRTYASDSRDGEGMAHFGFQSVPEGEKAEKVYKVFESVAQKYDIMNDAMSLGVHRLWKDALLRIMNPLPGCRLLDVAGGTGDISFRFLEYVRNQQERLLRRTMRKHQTPTWHEIAASYTSQQATVLGGSRAVVCDINKEMLKVGRQRAKDLNYGTGLSWVVGDAEELPFEDDQFDIYSIAFGIRNVTHMDKALQEAHGILKPSGRFLYSCVCVCVGQALQEAHGILKPSGRFLYSCVCVCVGQALQEAHGILKSSGHFLYSCVCVCVGQALQEAHGILKPNGHFLYSCVCVCVGQALQEAHCILKSSGRFLYSCVCVCVEQALQEASGRCRKPTIS